MASGRKTDYVTIAAAIEMTEAGTEMMLVVSEMIAAVIETMLDGIEMIAGVVKMMIEGTEEDTIETGTIGATGSLIGETEIEEAMIDTVRPLAEVIEGITNGLAMTEEVDTAAIVEVGGTTEAAIVAEGEAVIVLVEVTALRIEVAIEKGGTVTEVAIATGTEERIAEAIVSVNETVDMIAMVVVTVGTDGLTDSVARTKTRSQKMMTADETEAAAEAVGGRMLVTTRTMM
mmetsp:Transcript_55798/g.130560  ORF Transcript_55798/g.130560 Transcript_55798/m.130560 type:complete len:231 (-) Transcript_55798:262-954(-)